MSNKSVADPDGTVLQRTPQNLAVYAVYTGIVGVSAMFPFATRTRHFLSIAGPLGGLLVLVWILLRMTKHVRD